MSMKLPYLEDTAAVTAVVVEDSVEERPVFQDHTDHLCHTEHLKVKILSTKAKGAVEATTEDHPA